MILETIVKTKIPFDEMNLSHIDIYKKFISSRRWGDEGCPFMLEFPYLTIPDMIKDKLMYKFLKVNHESCNQ